MAITKSFVMPFCCYICLLLILVSTTTSGNAKPDSKLAHSYDRSFKESLDKVISDEDLKETIAQYVEIAPSSHYSRSQISRMAVFDNYNSKKDNNTAANQLRPRYFNPYMNIIKFIIDFAECRDERCPSHVCPIISATNYSKCQQAYVQEIEAADSNGCTSKCPVPDYCPEWRHTQLCPMKPKCPCGDNPDVAKDGEYMQPEASLGQKNLISDFVGTHKISNTINRSYNSSDIDLFSQKSPSSTVKPSSSTTMEPKSTSTNSKAQSSPRPETTGSSYQKNSTSISKVTFVNGMKITEKEDITKILSSRETLEAGLKLIVRNETIIKSIMDSIEYTPERAGGLESKLATKILMKYGDTPRVIKTKDRSMTYGTLKRNMVNIMGHVVGEVIKKHCKNCEGICKPITMNKCDSAISSTISTTTTTTTTKKPYHNVSKLGVCKPCGTVANYCPAPKGCPLWRCKRQPCQIPYHDGSTTTKSPQYNTNKGTSSRPFDMRTTPKYNTVDDPDFYNNEVLGLGPVLGLDDVDSGDPIPEDERFKEKKCQGYTCKYKSTCGQAELNDLTTKKKSTGYIVNGQIQKYGEWPSFAKIFTKISPDTPPSFCSGVLISERHVLTAGHCSRHVKPVMTQPKLGDPLPVSAYEVIIGEHETGVNDKFELRRLVKSVCLSRKFSDPKGDGSRYDFAILELDEKVQFNDHVQPACLPYKPFGLRESKCFVVGMGLTYNMGELQVSRFVRKLPAKRVHCDSWGFKRDDRSRWCFTRKDGPGDSCSGDSGGPILCTDPNNKWTVMGLVSYGSELCDGSDNVGWTAVYTRIPAIIDTIKQDCGI